MGTASGSTGRRLIFSGEPAISVRAAGKHEHTESQLHIIKKPMRWQRRWKVGGAYPSPSSAE